MAEDRALFLPVFVQHQTVLKLHARILSKTPGLSGVRSLNDLIAGVERARNKHTYGMNNIFILGAGYVFGIGKAHGFVDGNKRAGWATCVLFLKGHGIEFPDSEKTPDRVVELIAGNNDELTFADWLRTAAVPSP